MLFSGGDPIAAWHRTLLPADATIIGVDSGIDRAHEVGVRVDIAVGDFDSVTASGLVAAERAGATLIRHPTVKDRTDLELGIDVAIERRPERIVFAAMSGGRSDHELAAMMLLSDSRFRTIDVDLLLTDARVAVVQERRTLTGNVDDLVSLVPIGGDCIGVTTSGLSYPLEDETLFATSGRGVSNLMVSPVAVVSVRSGTLLAFQPRRTTARAERSQA